MTNRKAVKRVSFGIKGSMVETLIIEDCSVYDDTLQRLQAINHNNNIIKRPHDTSTESTKRRVQLADLALGHEANTNEYKLLERIGFTSTEFCVE